MQPSSTFRGLSISERTTRIAENGHGRCSKCPSLRWSSGLILSVNDNQISQDAEVIDGTACTLLPGLIDAHVHANDYHIPQGVDQLEILRTSLKWGVTTICDMHCDPSHIHKLRGDVEADVAKARSGQARVSLPDLKSSLYGATIDGGWPKPVVLAHNPSEELQAKVAQWPNLTPDTAADFVADHVTDGADYIKLMQEDCCSLALPTGSIPSASLELQTAVVKAAHDAGLLVVGHATSRGSTEIVLRSGADGLTHTFVDQSPTDDLLPLYQANNAFVIPTLVVLSSLTAELQDLREKFAKIAADLELVDEFSRAAMTRCLGMKGEGVTIEHAFETVRWFRTHGIDVVAGTDSAAGLLGTSIGPMLFMELDLYVRECGMTVLEALTSATSLSAKRLNFYDRGVIARNKRADLVLVKGDPTVNLEQFWQPSNGIVGVWKAGLRAV